MERDNEGSRREIDAIRRQLSDNASQVASALAALCVRHPSLREDLLLHRALGRLIERCPPVYLMALRSFHSGYVPSAPARDNARFYFFSRGGPFPAAAMLKQDHAALNNRRGSAETAAAQFYLDLCAFLWEHVEKNPMVKPVVAGKSRANLQCLPGGRK